MPLKCLRCGNYLDDDETVCPNCGESEALEPEEFYGEDEFPEDSYETDIYSYEHDDFKEIKDYSDDLLDEDDPENPELWEPRDLTGDSAKKRSRRE